MLMIMAFHGIGVTQINAVEYKYLEETGDPMVDEALDGRPWGKGSSGKEMVSTDKSSPCNVTEDTDDNVDISGLRLRHEYSLPLLCASK